ncbi:hypothetical protein DSO57_1031371 [Entomophthora muscae]|uniref:Uncharacterized protein n=1 Tax=Entomophthora muscae TaxID=34485 RepID=A0ACC2T0J4_9FUNG|nr:hypothetical protein DSO57_1031371 [Entomophthora muscae]
MNWNKKFHPNYPTSASLPSSLEGIPSLIKLLDSPLPLTHAQEMLQEFHKNNPQAVGPVKATLATMKLPPAHKNYALAALPGGGKSLLPKKESVTRPKRCTACSNCRFKSNNQLQVGDGTGNWVQVGRRCPATNFPFLNLLFNKS